MSAMHLEPHPAADLFPMMDAESFSAFKADISLRGLIEAIWICDGKILDGRNRYRACQELGIEVRTRDYTGESPVSFVWSLNGARRQLSKSELAAVAVEMLAPLEMEAKARMTSGTNQYTSPTPEVQEGFKDRGEAAAVAARLVGVGKTIVHQAKRVKRESPELYAEVRAGKMSVDKALRIATGEYKPPSPDAAKQPREKRAADIRRLTNEGHRAEQIGNFIGISSQQVRKIARDEGIVLADAQLGKTRRLDVNRVIQEMVHGLEGYALGLRAIDGRAADISKDDASHWAQSISESIRVIQIIRKQLLEIAK